MLGVIRQLLFGCFILNWDDHHEKIVSNCVGKYSSQQGTTKKLSQGVGKILT